MVSEEQKSDALDALMRHDVFQRFIDNGDHGAADTLSALLQPEPSGRQPIVYSHIFADVMNDGTVLIYVSDGKTITKVIETNPKNKDVVRYEYFVPKLSTGEK